MKYKRPALDPDVYAKIKSLAKIESTTVISLIAKMLKEYVKNNYQ